MKPYLWNFQKYRYFLYELILKDFKFKYRRSYLGVLWSLLNPLLMALILSIVFSNLFFRHTPNYIVYLLTGKIIFDFFSEATSTSMRAIVGNAALIRKIYVPKYAFPLSKVALALVNFILTHIVLFLFVIVHKIQINAAILFLPVTIILMFLFALGIGLVFSSAFVFFRDVGHLYAVGLTAWMYLTPIIYPVEIIPEKYMPLIKCNPLYYFIESYRQIILDGQMPSFVLTLTCLSISLLALAVGIFVFNKKQDKFILHI